MVCVKVVVMSYPESYCHFSFRALIPQASSSCIHVTAQLSTPESQITDSYISDTASSTTDYQNVGSQRDK